MTEITTYRTPMKREPCTLNNSILEGDLELAWRENLLESLRIMETDFGFYVTAFIRFPSETERTAFKLFDAEEAETIANLLSRPSGEWYLTTRRDRTAPKLFKDLNRLNEHLKENYPTDVVLLHRHEVLPGTPKTKVGMLSRTKVASEEGKKV